MKKNRRVILLSVLIVGMAVVFSCSKEVAPGESGLMAEKGERILKSLESCETCVNYWIDSKETFTLGTNLYLDVYNDATTVNYKLYRNSGATFGNLQYNGGSKISFDPGETNYVFSKSITDFEACKSVSVLFNKISGLGGAGGKLENVTNDYFLRELCTTTTLVADPAGEVCIGSQVILTANVIAGEVIIGGTLIIKDVDNVILASVSVTTSVHSLQYTYTTNSSGTDEFTAEYIPAAGYKESKSNKVSITGKDCGCKESFEYEKNLDGSYTFYYTPSEDLVNATIVFTFAQADRVSVYGLSDFSEYGQTLQKTMDFVKCQSVSWNVTLTPKFNIGSGNPNLWTDFKVNGSSKKNISGQTPNIIFP
jgi:hypothetical protein